MADFDKIDRNLQRLFKANAPDEHVSSYLQSEGVTTDQVKEWKASQRTAYDQYVKPVVQGVADAAQGAYTAVAGKHDPKYKGLPSIEEASGIIDPQAEMFAVSDAAYGDVYRKSLGDRYIGTEKDANGYEVITFRGDDGQPKQAYVNRPGLDGMDVNRAIGSAIPYMATAGLAGRAFKGLGTAANVLLQGATAGGTSIGQDIAAQSMGSKQAPDATRAGMATAFGAGGELAGRVLGPFVRKLWGDTSLVTKDGKLTPRGVRLAQKEGLDPDLVDAELAQEIARRATNAMDPAEALVQGQTDRFGIPTTKGQRTGDKQMLLIEKDIRAGTLGDAAKKQLTNLDDAQRAAIEGAARGGSDVPQTARNAIAPHLAPQRGVSDQRLDILGEGIKAGGDKAKATIKALEDAAWKKTENITATGTAFERLPAFVQKGLGSRLVDDSTPAALSMAKELDSYAKGKAVQRPGYPDILGQQDIKYIDQMRRRLMGIKDGAAPGADAAAAKSIYNSFDEWMKDAAESSLLTGQPGAAQALLNARRTTAELRGILKPMKDGKKTPAARILEKVGNAQTGEEVLTALLGASGPKSSVPQGGVDAIRRFKAAATKLGGDEGKAAWNDVRLAYWLKLVTGKNGEVLPNGTLVTSIKDSFANRPTLMKALFSENEQRLMKQYAQAIKAATPKDPNPPGSGTAVRGLFPKLVQDQLQVAASRNRLASTATGSAHKRFMAGIYRALSRVVPNVLDGKNVLGTAAAKRVVTQELTPRASPSLAGYVTAFSPSQTEDKKNYLLP